MSSRITTAFTRARAAGRAAFVPFLCGGDPNRETSLKACETVLAAGADLLEIGVPFSDPLADGPTNQRAAQRALDAGMTPSGVLDIVQQLRAGGHEAPVVLYLYYNLIYARGEKAFVAEAAAAGVDALLVLDLPPEESASLRELCAEAGLGLVFIVAPTTPRERLPIIAGAATSFLYYVSRTGVTGATDTIAEDLRERIAPIREATDLPIVVGFGVSKREHVEQVAAAADGVVVGSALVSLFEVHQDDPEAALAELRAKVLELIGGLARPTGGTEGSVTRG
ncbi:MAG: tryptophan synthase subunit alpha [Opitutales bacterium]